MRNLPPHDDDLGEDRRGQVLKDARYDSSSKLSKHATVHNAGLLLVQAASSGDIALLKRSIEAGVAIDTVSDDGSSALHCAARSGQLAIVKILLFRGADITIVNKNNRTPFQEAILGGNITTIEYMLNHNMSATDCPNSLLSTFDSLMRNPSAEVARSFVNHFQGNTFFKQQGLKLLRRAIKHKHIFLVRWLSLSENVKINGRPDTRYVPLCHAVGVGHLGVVEALLDSARLDPNTVGGSGSEPSTPLHIAVVCRALEIVKLLLQDQRVDVNAKTEAGESALYKASFQDNSEIVRLLLAHADVDVNVKTKSGESVLDFALDHKNLEIAKLLLAHPEVDVNAKTSSSEVLWYRSLFQAKSGIAELLLAHPKFDVNMKTSSGATALHKAVSNDMTGIAKLLLAHPKIDPNVTDDVDDQTPLHLAVWMRRFMSPNTLQDNSGAAAHSTSTIQRSITDPGIVCNHLRMIHLLCEAPKICFKLKNKEDKTALQLAFYHNCWPIVQCILQYAEAKKRSGTSAEIPSPLLGRINLFSLLQALIWHEDFQTPRDFKTLLFRAALYHVPQVISVMSQTETFRNIIKGNDTALALLCAVCTASQSSEALQHMLQQPHIHVNSYIDQGFTALHVAVMINSPKSVQILLRHPRIRIGVVVGTTWSDIDRRWNIGGDTAQQLACKAYDSRVVIMRLFETYEEKNACFH